MELQVLEQNVIVQAFATQGGSLLLVDRIAEEVRKHVPDVTTKKGRDAIGSLAAKVSKSKTIAEKYAKDLVAEEKARIKLVDDDRIQFVKRMDALRDEILAPRDAWEQAEKDRVAKHENAIKEITDFLLPENINVDAEILASNIRYLEKVPMGTMFEEYEEKIKIAKFETLESLRTALAAREKYEAEQAELERLRQAEQARLQCEHEERIAQQAAEQARIDAEQKAKAEIEKAEREKQEAIEREAKLKLEAEQAILREKQAKEDAERAAKQAEIDKQKAIEAERLRIEQQQKAEAEHQAKLEEQRKANIEHMRQINNDVLSQLVKAGISEDQAKAIITMIAKNEVPHVNIKY